MKMQWIIINSGRGMMKAIKAGIVSRKHYIYLGKGMFYALLIDTIIDTSF